jgi:hypothetical protein
MSGSRPDSRQFWQRHDPQAASGTYDRLGRRKSTFDNRWKPTTVVHDPDETEWASHVDNTAERILSVWLSKLNLEARRPHRVGSLSQRARIGVHAEIKILGKPALPGVCDV